MGRSSLDESRDIRGPGIGIAPHEQMHMIGLNSQLDNVSAGVVNRHVARIPPVRLPQQDAADRPKQDR